MLYICCRSLSANTEGSLFPLDTQILPKATAHQHPEDHLHTANGVLLCQAAAVFPDLTPTEQVLFASYTSANDDNLFPPMQPPPLLHFTLQPVLESRQPRD